MTDAIAATADPPLADEFDNPFRGLASYREEDADRFFGRATETRILVGHLRTARLTILYAESGVGKSSLIRAGVMATLDRAARTSISRRGTPEFVPVVFNQWRRDPVADLMVDIEAKARAYANLIAEAGFSVGAGTGDNGAAVHHDAENTTEPAPADLVRTITAVANALDAVVCIILDQFEDVFGARDHSAGFPDALAACVNDPAVRANILIAVREDAYGKLGDLLRGRIRNVYGNYFHLRYLTRDTAREAIEGPVPEPVTVGEGLTDAVLDQVRTDNLQLGSHRQSGQATDGSRPLPDEIEAPFLQLVMERLWNREREEWEKRPDEPRVLRKSTLEDELGGAQTIVAEHFDHVVAGLGSEQRAVATKLLTDLVTPSGAKIALTATDLAAKTDEGVSDTTAILSALERQRIVRQVDPAPGHEENRWELFHDRLARPIQNWGTEQERLHLEQEVQHGAREARRLQLRSQRLLFAIVALGAIVVTLVGYLLSVGPLTRLEFSTVDARFSIRGAERPDPNIILVTTDTHPPRATLAHAFDELLSGGARAVACDIHFGPAKKGDAVILAAVRRAGPRLVLVADSLNQRAQTQLFGGHVFPDPAGGGAAVGYGPLPGDNRNAILRTVESSVFLQAGQGAPQGSPMATLAAATARAAGVPLPLKAQPTTTWIDYRGGAGTFPRISLDDVVAGRPATLARLRGKTVVLGITTPDDVHDTSAPGTSRMDGVEIQANAISTALRDFPLRSPGKSVDAALIALLGLIPFLLALRFDPPMYLVGVAVTAALFCLVAQLLFDTGHVVNVVFPLASLLISGAGVLVVLLSRPVRQRRRRDASTDPDTVEQTAGPTLGRPQSMS